MRRASAHCRGTLSALPLGSAAFQVCKVEAVSALSFSGSCLAPSASMPGRPSNISRNHPLAPILEQSEIIKFSETGYCTAVQYDKDRVTMAFAFGSGVLQKLPEEQGLGVLVNDGYWAQMNYGARSASCAALTVR